MYTAKQEELGHLVNTLSELSDSKVRSRHIDVYGKFKLNMIHIGGKLEAKLSWIQRSTEIEYPLIRKTWTIDDEVTVDVCCEILYREIIGMMMYGFERQNLFKQITIRKEYGEY